MSTCTALVLLLVLASINPSRSAKVSCDILKYMISNNCIYSDLLAQSGASRRLNWATSPVQLQCLLCGMRCLAFCTEIASILSSLAASISLRTWGTSALSSSWMCSRRTTLKWIWHATSSTVATSSVPTTVTWFTQSFSSAYGQWAIHLPTVPLQP